MAASEGSGENTRFNKHGRWRLVKDRERIQALISMVGGGYIVKDRERIQALISMVGGG